jgi:hypothetical protein
MTLEEALDFVRLHGVVLASAKGPAERLASAIAGEAITGSWWAHPMGREIFAIFRALAQSPEILVCRFVDGKVTLVHCRLWPALVRLAHRYPSERLAQIHDEHSARGHHVAKAIAFPHWVPAHVIEQASALSEEEACAMMGRWCGAAGHGLPSPSRRSRRARA